LSRYKNSYRSGERRLLSVEEMAMLINSILDPRDRAIVTVLAKTGVRRGELVEMDVDDVDWETQSIRLKPKNKRSSLTVYFDDETAVVLQRWLRARENYGVKPGVKALFVGEHGKRLGRNGVYYAVTKHAERVGLHDPESDRVEDHFMPHCCRHWFTTHLRRHHPPTPERAEPRVPEGAEGRLEEGGRRHLRPHRPQRAQKSLPRSHPKTWNRVDKPLIS